MSEDENKPAIQQACGDSVFKRRILWCSDPNWEKRASVTIDYYADKLTICETDNGYHLELSVGGAVTCLPVKNIGKYVL